MFRVFFDLNKVLNCAAKYNIGKEIRHNVAADRNGSGREPLSTEMSGVIRLTVHSAWDFRRWEFFSLTIVDRLGPAYLFGIRFEALNCLSGVRRAVAEPVDVF
jgi:hypothetical protein